MPKPVTEPDYSAQLSHLCAAISMGREDLACYRQNFLGGHRQALKKTFPFTVQLLGEQVFAALAMAYVENYPSVHWDINRYGESFSTLLAAQCHGARADAYDWSLLSGIAQLEYGICRLYYSASDTVLTIASLPSGGSALTVGSNDIVMQGLMASHSYFDISPVINLAQPMLLRWQGLRLLLVNSAVRKILEGEDV
ncbi:DNA-binding domain-containing protein [bacterium]|nr:DNA-binding domain-containing protein [bacterium]